MTTPTTLRYDHPLQQDVATFHDAVDHPNNIANPGPLAKQYISLRLKLIDEEANTELGDEIAKGSVIGIIDALIDTTYVALGALVTMGHPVVAERLQYTVADRDGVDRLFVLASRYRLANIERMRALNAAFQAQDEGVSVYTLSVIAGAALKVLADAGIDPKPFFDEVQRSNMSKLGPDGKAIKSRGFKLDGAPKNKVLKGPNYFEPNLSRVYDELGLAR